MEDHTLCTRHAERLSAIEVSIAEGTRQFGEIDRKLDKIQNLLTRDGEPGGLCETVRSHDAVIKQTVTMLETVKGHDRIIRRVVNMVGVMACSIAAAAAKWIWDFFAP